MLALYFDGTPELKELPQPAPAPGEVLIRVSLAGICGTDLQILKGYHGFRGIMGHEFVGVVAGPGRLPLAGPAGGGGDQYRLRDLRPLPEWPRPPLPGAPGFGNQRP